MLEQIRVASGAPLSFKQKDITFSGHAIECRINAENPRTFRPSPGQITYWHPPGGLGVRVDSGVYQGYRIPPYYDSLIGKLIVHGKTRNECLMRLQARALGVRHRRHRDDNPAVQRADRAAGHRQRPLRYPLARKISRQVIVWSPMQAIDDAVKVFTLGSPAITGGPEPTDEMASRDDIVIEITPQVLLKAYSCGIFPMAESAEDPALYWIEPQHRGILPLDKVHVPRRLARTLRATAPSR